MRKLKKINQLVNNLNSNKPIDYSSDEFKYIEKVYNIYKDELNLLKKPKNASNKEKFTELLIVLYSVKQRFTRLFKKACEEVPGMRWYLLTHIVYDINDNHSYDWLKNFVIEYLTPTNEEVERFKEEFVNVPDIVYEAARVFDADFIPEFYDEELITIGMWDRDIRDKIVPPINIVDTLAFPCNYIGTTEMSEILSKIDIIDLSKEYGGYYGVIRDEKVEQL